MKKPLSKLAAIAAVVFIALGLMAPNAFGAGAPVVNATVTNQQSTTTVGAGTVTIINQDTTDLPAEVWVNGTVYKTVTVAGTGSETVFYTGLSVRDVIQVVGNHVLLATFTVDPVTIAVPGYRLTPAGCVNGTLVSGSLRVVGAANVSATINGEPTSGLFSGLGPVTLAFQTAAGYTFVAGPQVIIPLDLGHPVCTPPAPVDTDNDGITDDIDKCPATPAGTKVDNTGCPELKKEVPAAPTPDDKSGVNNDAVIILASDCAIYTTASGTVLPAGRNLLKDYAESYNGGNFTVLVHAAEGCELTGLAHYNWPFNFSNEVEETSPPPVKEEPKPEPAKESPAPAHVPEKVTAPVVVPAQPVAAAVPTTTVQQAALSTTSDIQTAETAAGGEGLGWFTLLAGSLLVIAATSYRVAGRLRRS